MNKADRPERTGYFEAGRFLIRLRVTIHAATSQLKNTMLPLISCICPTRDRRQYIPGAIACFYGQKWPHKELIVIDSGDDPVTDLMPSDSRIRYYRVDGKPTIGEARNLACKVAWGEYIAHWDDDDGSHPLRLKEQHKLLLSYQRGLVGYNSMIFLDTEDRKAYLYDNASEGYALGTSFFYRFTTWKAHHFPDKQVNEDGEFINAVGGALAIPAGDRMIARIHAGNTSPKRQFTDSWIPHDYEQAMRIAEGCK